MQQLVCTALALFFFSFVPPQDGEIVKLQAKLFHRFETGVSLHRLEESLIDLANDARKPGATMAVRICSSEPIEKALFFSALNPQAVYDYMRNSYGYSTDRIRLLRSNDCTSANPTFAATELWVISRDAAAPASVESIDLCQLRSEAIPLTGKIQSARSFRKALQQLIGALHKQTHRVGIIDGYYLKRATPSMIQSLAEARRVLRQNGLMADRYVVRLWPWHDELPIHTREPKYPTIVTAEILKNCQN